MLFIFLSCLTIQYLLNISKTSSSILKLYYTVNKNGLISSISAVRSTKDMQILNEESRAYFNFINSLRSESTKKSYRLCLEKFLNQYQIDLASLLKLPQDDLTNLIIKYLVEKKISKQYKSLISATLKHACEINDIVLNWRKIKKFINFEKTGNETNGKDRGYAEKEIQKILEFGDQRLKTAFLVLASTGIRVGALQSIRIHDLERVNNMYKVTIYSGDREEYFTFCTPECAKEIDSYLEYRKRRGEHITQDSYLLVRKFSQVTEVKGKSFKGKALPSILQHCIDNSGLREINHTNPYKRKTVPIFHGFRKFFTKQLVDSKLNPEIREMLLGHKIGLASCYYRPTEQEMLNEYSKAIDLLTINEENKLKRQVENLQIEKSRIEALEISIKKLEEKYHNN